MVVAHKKGFKREKIHTPRGLWWGRSWNYFCTRWLAPPRSSRHAGEKRKSDDLKEHFWFGTLEKDLPLKVCSKYTNICLAPKRGICQSKFVKQHHTCSQRSLLVNCRDGRTVVNVHSSGGQNFLKPCAEVNSNIKILTLTILHNLSSALICNHH